MNKTLVTAFGDFLENDVNSTEEFLKEMPESCNIIKHIFPVGYFKNDFIKTIKKHQPKRVIFLGMDINAKYPKLEIIAKNEMVTLKNPIYRFIGTIYSYWLKLNGKNLRIDKPISKDLMTVFPIAKNNHKQIKLRSKVPNFKEIKISKDAGNYVCNYSMWIAENYIRENNLNIDFYFIHLPSKLTKNQKNELLKFVCD